MYGCVASFSTKNYIHIYISVYPENMYVCKYVSLYVYVCMYILIYIYIYIFIHTYIYVYMCNTYDVTYTHTL